MRALLISFDNLLYMTEAPEAFRGPGEIYQLPTPQPISTAYGHWTKFEPVKVRNFQWRGQVVRKDGTPIFDFFEEI